MPRFSIVIPTHDRGENGPKWMRELLDSLKIQTFQDFDIVVPDQSKNDKILDTCKEYSEDFEFTYIRYEGEVPCENINIGLKECFGDDEYIGLHIRRTDYVQKQSYHPLCTLDYYERALKKLPNIQVIIVSDDPKWCENQELFKPDRFLISDSGSNIVDMCILSLCKYHVIANSSFSWWGAWLAESEKVIAPNIWFGSQANLDDSDLVPQHWERI